MWALEDDGDFTVFLFYSESSDAERSNIYFLEGPLDKSEGNREYGFNILARR